MTDITNNDLILREKLAIERTRLANDRTLLSFIRTSLYFGIAGVSIDTVLSVAYGWIMEIGFVVISLLLLVIGIFRYRRVRINLEQTAKNFVI
jgi:putative membrane protein